MPQTSSKEFSGIFICYRREDSSGHAGRLFDKLVGHFGYDRIFMDIDTIEPGEDFVTAIEEAVGSCKILIAIIGRHWLSGTGEPPGWLDNPNDFVRVEISTALRRNIRVIPVLVQRAKMPKPQDLPDDLAKLLRRNAVELSDLRWQHDVNQLIGVLESVLDKQEEARLAELARLAEAECQRQEEEEKRQVEEERLLRLAEEEAKQRAGEERRREEQKRREAEERESRDAQEVSSLSARKELQETDDEKRRIAEIIGRRFYVDQTRHLEGDKRAARAKEGVRQDGAELQKAVQEVPPASPDEKQTTPDLVAVVADPSSRYVVQLSDNQAPTSLTDATLLQEKKRKQTMLLVMVGCLVVLAIVGYIWIRRASERTQPATNAPARTLQAEPVINALPTATPTPSPTPSPTPTPIPTPDKSTFQKTLDTFITKQLVDSYEVKDRRKIAYGDLNADGADDAAVSFCETRGTPGTNLWCRLLVFSNVKGVLTFVDAHNYVGDQFLGGVRHIKKGRIICSTYAYLSNDAACCPSLNGEIQIVLVGKKLKQVQ